MTIGKVQIPFADSLPANWRKRAARLREERDPIFDEQADNLEILANQLELSLPSTLAAAHAAGYAQARNEQMERDCAAVCKWCDMGHKAYNDYPGIYTHAVNGALWHCYASLIRFRACAALPAAGQSGSGESGETK